MANLGLCVVKKLNFLFFDNANVNRPLDTIPGLTYKRCMAMGPGLVVRAGDSKSKGFEFESHGRILDGHIFALFSLR